jgi:hypothetical protein
MLIFLQTEQLRNGSYCINIPKGEAWSAKE